MTFQITNVVLTNSIYLLYWDLHTLSQFRQKLLLGKCDYGLLCRAILAVLIS